MKNVEFVAPSGIFTNYIYKTIPLAFDESMSYYEVLAGLLAYLKDTVLPAINNNAEATAELQIKVTELEDYVKHYFDNLDIQQEINNKLDEMAESGELTDIIAQYLDLAGVLAFDNVNALKNAENIANGSICKTLGYYNVNDGGGASYKIRTITNQDTIDEAFILAIVNDETLVAELIYESPINVLTLGVKKDGTSDISTIINNATLKANLYFPSGKYLVSNQITLKKSIFGENFTRFITTTPVGTAFISNITCEYEDREELSVFDVSTVENDFNMSNVSIQLNEYECGIKGTSMSNKYIYFDKIGITNIKSTGIYLQGSYSSRLAYLDNITLFGTRLSYENSRGMYISLWDSKANNLEIMGCRVGTKFEGFVQGSNYHIWCGSLQGGDGVLNHTTDESWFGGTKALITKDCMLDNIYLDTAYYKVVGEGTPNSANTKMITNLKTLDDSSMDNYTGTQGYTFYGWAGSVSNHENHISKFNKNHSMSTEVRYLNEMIVLNISESDYINASTNGSNLYYPVHYKYVKDITNTAGSILELAKIKTGGTGRAGMVMLYILHANARAVRMLLRFRNGNFYNATIDNADLSGDVFYITTNKDANNMYTLYILPADKTEEYMSVQAEFRGAYNNIQVLDLSYKKADGTGYDPVILSDTTGLTQITSA